MSLIPILPIFLTYGRPVQEPTTGLDARAAGIVIRAVQRACHHIGRTVVCTIHQPSIDSFQVSSQPYIQKNGPIYEVPCIYLRQESCQSERFGFYHYGFVVGATVQLVDGNHFIRSMEGDSSGYRCGREKFRCNRWELISSLLVVGSRFENQFYCKARDRVPNTALYT
jgi:hypothetical protein